MACHYNCQNLWHICCGWNSCILRRSSSSHILRSRIAEPPLACPFDDIAWSIDVNKQGVFSLVLLLLQDVPKYKLHLPEVATKQQKILAKLLLNTFLVTPFKLVPFLKNSRLLALKSLIKSGTKLCNLKLKGFFHSISS